MKFKNPSLEMEFVAGLHPEVKAVIVELDEWCQNNGYPEVFVTHVLRTREDQEVIYWKSIKDSSATLSEKEARKKARGKFSWHLGGCAIDIRNKSYTSLQLANVMAHLKLGRAPHRYEILSHDVGNGEHIHFGIKDVEYSNSHTVDHKDK
jgi:hypothetical protein